MTARRRTYETKEDRGREKTTIDFVKDKMQLGELVKLPVKYRLDQAELNDDKYIMNFLEIKNRTIPKELYNTYMISADKMMSAYNYVKNFNVGFKLIVRWKDVVGYYTIKRDDYFSLGFNGRVDRGDWQDVEPVVYIPIKEFKDVY